MQGLGFRGWMDLGGGIFSVMFIFLFSLVLCFFPVPLALAKQEDRVRMARSK